MDFKEFRKLLDLAESKGYKPHIDNNAYPTLNLKDYWYLELCLCQKWLRDEHRFHIHFCIWGEDETWHFDVYDFDGGLLNFPEIKRLPSYEEALLQGIYKVLKLLP